MWSESIQFVFFSVQVQLYFLRYYGMLNDTMNLMDQKHSCNCLRFQEAFATTFQSALRTATTEPCILLLPSIDQWYQVVPPSVSHMVVSYFTWKWAYICIFSFSLEPRSISSLVLLQYCCLPQVMYAMKTAVRKSVTYSDTPTVFSMYLCFYNILMFSLVCCRMPSIPVNRRQLYFRYVIGPARVAPKEFDG